MQRSSTSTDSEWGQHHPHVQSGVHHLNGTHFVYMFAINTCSQSIRPMPRASEQALRIIEQLETVRESIQSLNDQLKQVGYLTRAFARLQPLITAHKRRPFRATSFAQINGARGRTPHAGCTGTDSRIEETGTTTQHQ